MTLSKKKITEFQQRLEEMHQQLSVQLRESKDEVKSPDSNKGYSQHQADEGTDDFDRMLSLGLTSEKCELMRQIERALEKIQEGSYGKCDITGDEIPVVRLDAIPYATMTVTAQDKLEKGLL
jgi:RNA polymerase-binding transcription factor